jgi:hypothetical protein
MFFGSTYSDTEIYSFPFFSPEFCLKLLTEVENFKQMKHDSGVALRLSFLSLDQMIEAAIRQNLFPILPQLFPSFGNLPIELFSKIKGHDPLVVVNVLRIERVWILFSFSSLDEPVRER